MFVSLALLLCLLCAPTQAHAASWQWNKNGSTERIVVRLDAPQAADAKIGSIIKANRIGQHAVFVPINADSLLLQGTSPKDGDLVAGLQNHEGGILLQVQNSAFGHMARLTSPTEIVIDVFPDPLGARWRPDGTLAPAGTQGVAAQPLQRGQTGQSGQPSVPPMPHVTPQQVSPHAPLPVSPQPSPEQDVVVPPVQIPALPPEAFKKAPYLVADATGASGSHASGSHASGSDGQFTHDADFANALLVSDAQGLDNAHLVANLETRGETVSPQEVLGRVNKGGPEDWPSEESLGTYLPSQTDSSLMPLSEQGADGHIVSPAPAPVPAPVPAQDALPTQSPRAQPQPVAPPIQPVQEATQAPAPSPAADNGQSPASQGADEIRQPVVAADTGTEEQAVDDRPVIYHDEQGNVIPEPPDPDKLFAEAEKLMDTQKYSEALPILEQLRGIPTITQAMREQVLYYISDATATLYQEKPLEGFDAIVTTTNEAMNANLRSARVPDALYRLGLANLSVKNFPEAEAYFQALQRRFPYDMNVPTAFYQLGDALLEAGLYAEAAENFRLVVQEYPDASALQEATVGFVKALAKNKEYEEASVFADFASKRWARHYIEDPEYLLYLAEIEYKLGNLKGALDQYWLLYNLDPDHERNDLVLATIGDIYIELGKMDEALEVFATIQEVFPDSRGAAIASLRQAELGIHDTPLTIEEMFAVFDNPGEPLPQVLYKELQKAWPEDKRSITSQLKYALWQLWDKQYTDAMGAAADFIDLHPENGDVELARDIIMRGFMADLKNSLAEENYGRILILWEGFPLVRQRYGDIDPDLRNALGRGHLERGEDEKAMELFAEFLTTPKHPRYSDQTFALYFNKYLESQNWNGMLDLGEMVKDWEMTDAMRGQLDYALALSSENLGLKEKALKLWKPLAVNDTIPLYQKAYANHFLAKNAEERKDIKEAYAYNVKTLELFEQLHEERSPRADNERIKHAMGSLMDITEVANRIPEALDWVERYNRYVPEDSPEYPGLRFREARLYRKLGNDDRAKMLLQLITTGYPDSPFAAAAATELSTFEVSRDLQNFMQGANTAQ